jgi:hypothetical protein
MAVEPAMSSEKKSKIRDQIRWLGNKRNGKQIEMGKAAKKKDKEIGAEKFDSNKSEADKKEEVKLSKKSICTGRESPPI